MSFVLAVVNHCQHQYDFISQIAEQYKKEIQNTLSAFRTKSKLRSERDRAMVAMKDQMVNRGNSLLKAVRLTRSSPVETVPPKVEFPWLQNIL